MNSQDDPQSTSACICNVIHLGVNHT